MEVVLEFDNEAGGKLAICSRHDTVPALLDIEPGPSTITVDLELSVVDQIRIRYYDRHGDGAVMLKSISVDSIDLQHFVYRGTFFPDYNYEWFQEAQPEHSYCPGTHWHHEGEWCIDIVQPIWKFMMESHNE